MNIQCTFNIQHSTLNSVQCKGQSDKLETFVIRFTFVFKQKQFKERKKFNLVFCMVWNGMEWYGILKHH